ncbi:hypothetical protein [Chroococcidiopsis sp [FACHB-1243]]|nr:hypothetical protein [Chroococcidiopsis sp. [FACHB-1243]]
MRFAEAGASSVYRGEHRQCGDRASEGEGAREIQSESSPSTSA